MDLAETLLHVLRHLAHLDESDAAIHCAPVRWSPLTFRVAEQLADLDAKAGGLDGAGGLVDRVLRDAGVYAEDRGR